MITEDIISALKSPDRVPDAALTAAVAKAGELAPIVAGLVERLCRGVYLMPGDDAVLFYGLHALAAARHPGLLDNLMSLVRQPSDELDRLFLGATHTSLARMILSVWDRDASDLVRLIELGDLAPEVKWALYDVLARLAFDKRIARQETAEFLARIERDGLIDGGDITWWGWVSAVAKLGLTELEPALRRVWAKPVYGEHTDEDHAGALETLRRAAIAPDDPSVFDEAGIRPIDDAVEAVAWTEQRAHAMADWAAERAADVTNDGDSDTDPGRADALSEAERMWLDGFLTSRQAPASTMSLEMLDGFMTALVIGPDVVLPSEYLPVVWGTESGDGPDWDSLDQFNHVIGLFTRHWNAIAARRLADAPHHPLVHPFGAADLGEEWVNGFFSGIEMRPDAWRPLLDDRRVDQLLLPILALAGEAPGKVKDAIDAEARQALVDQLPALLQLIASYWKAPDRGVARVPVSRGRKVGRNEPCPCGSGKKFKRCCGSPTGSTVH